MKEIKAARLYNVVIYTLPRLDYNNNNIKCNDREHHDAEQLRGSSYELYNAVDTNTVHNNSVISSCDTTCSMRHVFGRISIIDRTRDMDAI